MDLSFTHLDTYCDVLLGRFGLLPTGGLATLGGCWQPWCSPLRQACRLLSLLANRFWSSALLIILAAAHLILLLQRCRLRLRVALFSHDHTEQFFTVGNLALGHHVGTMLVLLVFEQLLAHHLLHSKSVSLFGRKRACGLRWLWLISLRLALF